MEPNTVEIVEKCITIKFSYSFEENSIKKVHFKFSAEKNRSSVGIEPQTKGNTSLHKPIKSQNPEEVSLEWAKKVVNL